MSRTLLQVRGSVRRNIRVSARQVSDDDLNDFINQAIDSAEGGLWYELADESISLVTDTYEYDLSTATLIKFDYIREIWLESSTAGRFDVLIPNEQWEPQYVSDFPELRFFAQWFTPVNGRKVRLIGWVIQSRISDDDDVIYIDPVYVVMYASALAHGVLLLDSDSSQPARINARNAAFQLADSRRRRNVQRPSFPAKRIQR